MVLLMSYNKKLIVKFIQNTDGFWDDHLSPNLDKKHQGI